MRSTRKSETKKFIWSQEDFFKNKYQLIWSHDVFGLFLRHGMFAFHGLWRRRQEKGNTFSLKSNHQWKRRKQYEREKPPQKLEKERSELWCDARGREGRRKIDTISFDTHFFFFECSSDLVIYIFFAFEAQDYSYPFPSDSMNEMKETNCLWINSCMLYASYLFCHTTGTLFLITAIMNEREWKNQKICLNNRYLAYFHLSKARKGFSVVNWFPGPKNPGQWVRQVTTVPITLCRSLLQVCVQR